MAHRLHAGASEKCATPHGHNEYVRVRLAGETERLDGHANMVVEFGALKRTWHRFIDDHIDHALQLDRADPLLPMIREQFSGWRLVITPGDPTTELLAALLASKCQAFMNAASHPVRVIEVHLEETPTNSVIFRGDPAQALPPGNGWWTRADMSTRDDEGESA